MFEKDKILKQWGRLAEADVENAHGNLQALNKLVKNEFMDEIQRVYDELKTNNSIKSSRPVYPGQRDNAPERKLNENYSRINSPEEVKSNYTDTPTIFEDEIIIH